MELYVKIATAVVARMHINFHYISCLYVYGSKVISSYLTMVSLQLTVWSLRESNASNAVTIQFGSKVACMKFQRMSTDGGHPLPYIVTTASEVTVYWEDSTADSAALYVLTVASRHTLEFKTTRVRAKKHVTRYHATGTTPLLLLIRYTQNQNKII